MWSFTLYNLYRGKIRYNFYISFVVGVSNLETSRNRLFCRIYKSRWFIRSWKYLEESTWHMSPVPKMPWGNECARAKSIRPRILPEMAPRGPRSTRLKNTTNNYSRPSKTTYCIIATASTLKYFRLQIYKNIHNHQMSWPFFLILKNQYKTA